MPPLLTKPLVMIDVIYSLVTTRQINEVQLRNARGQKFQPPAGIKTHDLPDTGPQHFVSHTYNDCNIYFITIGWLVNKANDTFLNRLRKNNVEA